MIKQTIPAGARYKIKRNDGSITTTHRGVYTYNSGPITLYDRVKYRAQVDFYLPPPP